MLVCVSVERELFQAAWYKLFVNSDSGTQEIIIRNINFKKWKNTQHSIKFFPEVRRMHWEDDPEQWNEVPIKEGGQCQQWMGRQHIAGIQQQIFFGAQSVTSAGTVTSRI